MISEEDKKFIEYWEANREKQKSVLKQFLIGIPIGLLFAIAISINFFSGWYKRAEMVSNTSDFNPLVLIFALLVIIAFIAIFSKRHQWDMREQHYRELLAKQEDEDDPQSVKKN